MQLLFEHCPAPLAVAGHTLQLASHLFSSALLAQVPLAQPWYPLLHWMARGVRARGSLRRLTARVLTGFTRRASIEVVMKRAAEPRSEHQRQRDNPREILSLCHTLALLPQRHGGPRAASTTRPPHQPVKVALVSENRA